MGTVGEEETMGGLNLSLHSLFQYRDLSREIVPSAFSSWMASLNACKYGEPFGRAMANLRGYSERVSYKVVKLQYKPDKYSANVDSTTNA